MISDHECSTLELGCSISLWLSSQQLYTGGYDCMTRWQTFLSKIWIDFSAVWLWTFSWNLGKPSRKRYACWRTLKNFPFLPKKMKTDETILWNINWFSQSSSSCLRSAINISTIQPSKIMLIRSDINHFLYIGNKLRSTSFFFSKACCDRVYHFLSNFPIYLK